MLYFLNNIDTDIFHDLIRAEKRCLSIIKSRIEYRKGLGHEVHNNDPDAIRQRLIVSRIEDLKSLNGINRKIRDERLFVRATMMIKPSDIILTLPEEYSCRSGIAEEIQMLMQTREKQYFKLMKDCDKLEMIGLSESYNEISPDDEMSSLEQRQRVLYKIRRSEDQLPLMRKKIYKLFFGMEERNRYSFIRNQMDDEILNQVLIEAEKMQLKKAS